MIARLKFGRANAKLRKWWKRYKLATFSLPAGFTCPGALQCLTRSDRATGKLTDGPHNQFRCYAASAEALFSNIRVGRWRNFEALKACETVGEMSALIERSLPRQAKLVRIHQSGDYYSQMYFDAWLYVAVKHPAITFYGYTKALHYWVERLTRIPGNMRLVASLGGRFDHLAERHNLRTVQVVFTEAQAARGGYKIDHDDSLIWTSTESFALLLHGTQPAGSAASKAWQLIKGNEGGYQSDYFAHYGGAR